MFLLRRALGYRNPAELQRAPIDTHELEVDEFPDDPTTETVARPGTIAQHEVEVR